LSTLYASKCKRVRENVRVFGGGVAYSGVATGLLQTIKHKAKQVGMATYPLIKSAQLPHYLSIIRPLITSSNKKPQITIYSKTITKVISSTAPFAEFCKLNNDNIYRVSPNLRVI